MDALAPEVRTLLTRAGLYSQKITGILAEKTCTSYFNVPVMQKQCGDVAVNL
jgi:hypothetical protein